MIKLTPLQLDVLQEFINIGIGRAAGILNQMSKVHVILTVPEISVLDSEELLDSFQAKQDERCSAVTLAFRGNLSGTAHLLFPPQSAASLVSIILGGDSPQLDMDSLRIGTLQEVGNIVLNGVMGSITNLLKEHVDYYSPDYFEDSVENILHLRESRHMVLIARAQFTLEKHTIHGDIIILFLIHSFANFIAAIDRVSAGVGRP